MKKRIWIPALLALALVLAMGIAPTWAYFTATTSALGGLTITIGPSTDIEEEVQIGVKHVVISADEDSEPVYVRARAYWGDSAGTVTYGDIELDQQGTVGWSDDTNWTAGGDGWYYYGPILNGGESADEFLVSISRIRESKDDLIDGENFSVVVVYEATPVQYDEAGQPYADWSITLDNGEGGN